MLNLIVSRRKLPFPFNLLFHWNEPEYYIVKCNKCGWQKMFRISNGTVWYAPGIVPVENIVKTKSELPAVCPECGGKVKKVKLPNFYKE